MTNERVLVAKAAGAATEDEAGDFDAVFHTRIQGKLAASYRLAAVILGDPSEAEDATQDALEQAWRSRGQLRDPSRFDPWFQRILVNACIDRVRRRRSRPLLLAISAGDQNRQLIQGESDPYMGTVERDAVKRALDRLKIEQRVVIALRFYLDLEIDEIARRLGTPNGTVKSRLHRGLKELRQAWEEVR